MKYSKTARKCIALTLIFILASQLLLPNIAMALTTGPTQPEAQSFEPVGTTDMVDMFSGAFVYNIPLMDVEGYPVNISYHGGVNMEQEATWVGLGWNINPGVINRTVRGLPDDFDSDIIDKQLNIKEEKTLRVGIGVGVELVGLGDPLLSISVSLGANVTFNNYRGTSCDFDIGAGINLFNCVSAGVNIGVGSATGAEIGYNAGLTMSSSQLMSDDMAGGIGVGVSQGYSSRTGLTDINLSVSFNENADGISSSQTSTDKIPIGLKNFVPVITNSSSMHADYGRVKLGGELLWMYGYFTANGMFSHLNFNNDGSRNSYGYMYLQNSITSGSQCILDFTRDKDGQFNKSMQYLPMANLTYDIYTVTGQGTGGSYRPFRNDFGSVYDPITSSSQTSNTVGLEAGLGWVFEVGGNYTGSVTNLQSGPWPSYAKNYTPSTSGSIYEASYLKQGGELTSVDSAYFTAINGFDPIDPTTLGSLPATKPNSSVHRDPRGDLMYYYTAQEASVSGVGTNPNIVSYLTEGFSGGPNVSQSVTSRIGSGPLNHKSYEISEIVQLQKDGKKYVYGLPVLNHVQREATFSVNHGLANLSSGLVSFTPGTDDNIHNGQGLSNYYSGTTTPSYVSSYLLTSVLSADYVDVTGDGPTDDDLGSYTKFNYTQKSADYRWRAPMVSGQAQYDPGFRSDPTDDKGSFVIGSREEWLLHSIETKNFVAEFYTSPRSDGAGSGDPVVYSPNSYAVSPYNDSIAQTPSYELDSIKLYNKHDRFINTNNAVPIKTVYFVYSYSLCPGAPNSSAPGNGKLTLNKIYFKYGNSQKSMISPYQFSYSSFNPSYNASCKDRWGNYKPNNAAFPNFEYPFVNQNDTANNTYASAWSLSCITLPSGGVIQANYESNDYAYVQDQPANEMFMVSGVGNGPGFVPSDQLYANPTSQNLYIYFQRSNSRENPSLSFSQNYLNDQSVIYYNFNVQLNDADISTYEQIKGYANVVAINACPGTQYGYVQLQPVMPTGSDLNLNPITYTALNTARYSLPGAIFPGSGVDPSGFDILHGIKSSFEELASIFKNPIVNLVKQKHDAKVVDLSKSFIRLQSPGLCKKGGGQRVKSLLFYDHWNALAGGNEHNASYGKNYYYTGMDDTYGLITSGVASYEPMIGGDENPLRQPAPYIAASGSNWPPNDPVSLYQELPLGETLFPPPVVGYSRVTVTSIHKGIANSSQGFDVYQFYTANDFPAQVNATAINTTTTNHFDFFSQENAMTATQGYSLIFNDMHGKPKSVEHYVSLPATGGSQMISYQVYNYHMAGGLLDNHVNCIVQDPVSHQMMVQNKQLGIEADVTIDSRNRDELTTNNTWNANLNVAGILWFILPIPLAYPWPGSYENQFQAATVTKVVQQYGILDNVESYNEGAVTTQRNELFDPQTGQVVVTSVNNEYEDTEYTVKIPAYWGYLGMYPAYNNIKFQMTIPSVTIDAHHRGYFPTTNPYLNVGDELLCSYNVGSTLYSNVILWYMGDILTDYRGPCRGFLLPRFPTSTPGWTDGATLTNVQVEVVNSGNKNILDKTIENYTMLDNPVDGSGFLKTALDSVISLKATTYAESNTVVMPDYISNPDTINPYAIGERGVFREQAEYVYITNRKYASTTSRNAGLFDAERLFSQILSDSNMCTLYPVNYMSPYFGPDWYAARTITKWSPYGKEVENVDAVGNYSSAVYGYNQELPTAVASNAQQGEVFSDGFEDYALLQYKDNLLPFNYSPFASHFGTTPMSPASSVYDLLQLSNPSDLSIVYTSAHTGECALSVNVSSGGITGVYALGIPVNNNSYSSDTNHYLGYGSAAYSALNAYLPFQLSPGNQYVLSFWAQPSSITPNATAYALNDSCGMTVNGTFYGLTPKSNIIDGWQQFEVTFNVPSLTTAVALRLPANYLIDDIRFFPATANMKSFVYNPTSEKLMATLDENNFATLYEYDQEGNLVRVKKETQKGIMTVSESRSSNPKQ